MMVNRGVSVGWEAVADTLKQARPEGNRPSEALQEWLIIVRLFARRFGSFGNFDRDVFYEACGGVPKIHQEHRDHRGLSGLHSGRG